MAVRTGAQHHLAQSPPILGSPNQEKAYQPRQEWRSLASRTLNSGPTFDIPRQFLTCVVSIDCQQVNVDYSNSTAKTSARMMAMRRTRCHMGKRRTNPRRTERARSAPKEVSA